MNGDFLCGGGKVMHDGSGGRHRVPGHELAAAQEGAEGKGLIAVELAMVSRLRLYTETFPQLSSDWQSQIPS